MQRSLERFGWPAVLLLINAVIVRKLFALDYTAYLGSIEGNFIALSRIVAEHWPDLRWWPLWDGGFPFQFTYLPFLPLKTAGWMLVTGESASLAFHQVTAIFFCLGSLAVYFMALGFTRRANLSFLCALTFSLFSPCVWLFPLLRADNGGLWNLRRLRVLVFWGEAPHIVMLAFLPVALLFLWLSIRDNRWRDKVLAGLFCALTVLSNAFGATILALAALAIVLSFETRRVPRNALTLGAIGLFAYAWISPFVPPSVLAAIRADAPTSGGDYRFTTRSLEGVILLAAGLVLVWFLSRRAAPELRFLLYFTFLMAGIVGLGVVKNIYVVPQAHRYQIAMDMGFCMCAILFADAVLRARPAILRQVLVAALLIACAVEFRHGVRYANDLIRSSDIEHTGAYRVAHWFDTHMGGQRVMVSGSYSLFFNDFTDSPQALGAHDQMAPNYVMRIANYVLYAGTDPVSRDAEISVLWLRALGANAVSVPGPQSEEYYKPYTHPNKFEGVLPVLWRESDDTIYDVPARSRSLAHIVPDNALIVHQPVNGLDVDEMGRYVKALDDPAMPQATLIWTSWHSAYIDAATATGQALSVQISYAPGWRAEVQGRRLPIVRDGFGYMTLHPDCSETCRVDLHFGYSAETIATTVASLIVMIGVIVFSLRARTLQTPVR